MNWPVFWFLVTGVGVGLAIVAFLIWLTGKLERLVGEPWASCCLVVVLTVGLSAIFGMLV